MNALKSADGLTQPGSSERESERNARIERELKIIERAEAALEAGLGIEDDDLEKWLDDLDVDENTPLPKSSGRKIFFR